MALRQFIDSITSAFGDTPTISQKDVLDEVVRKQFPQYATVPDAELAAAAGKHDPEKFGFWAESGFDPGRTVPAPIVPHEMRTPQFYQRNPAVAKLDALKTLDSIRAEIPTYKDVPDEELVAAAEQNNPAKYAGLTSMYHAEDVYKAQQEFRQKTLDLANGVAHEVMRAIQISSGTPQVEMVRDAFNSKIAPVLDQAKKNVVDYWAPSEEDIVKHAQDTNQIPYAKILKRTAITTAVDQLPAKLEDFAMWVVAPMAIEGASMAASSAAKNGARLLESKAPALSKLLTELAKERALAGPFKRVADALNRPLGGVPRGTPAETPALQPPAAPGSDIPAAKPELPQIEKSAIKLNPEQSRIEAESIKLVQENFPQMAAQYREKFGKTLNVDDARKLFPAYEASHESRLANAAAGHEPASALVKGIYETMMREPDPTGRNTVLFMAGGGGSGKTSTLRYNDAFKPFLDQAQVVVDGTLANPKSAAYRIDRALAADKNVQIVTIYRDPQAAFAHALERAQSTGRPVPLEAFAAAHEGYPKTIKLLQERYKGDPRVDFHFIDNNQGAGNARLSTIDVLDKAGYTEREALRRIADDAYHAGKISEAVYRGTVGEAPPVRPGIGVGDGQKPQPISAGGPAAAAEVQPAAPQVTPPAAEAAPGVLNVPIQDIHTSPERFQPRKELIQSRVGTIAESIKEKGFSPSKPIIAWQDPKDGNLYVLAGHHRLEAAKRAGLDKVPVVVEPGTEAQAIAMARRSNSTRAPMSPVEEAKAYKAESDTGASFAEISKNYGGVKVSEIQRKMNLNNLSSGLQDLVTQDQFSLPHAIELGRAAGEYGLSDTVQQQIFNEVVKKMDVTPATFRTMLDSLGPAAAKQVEFGLDFKIDQGILTPLKELAGKASSLERAKRQLSGYVKYIDSAAKAGEKVSAAQLTARNQAERTVAKLQKDIVQLQKSVGKVAAPPADLSKTIKPDMESLFPEPASAETGAVRLGPDSQAMKPLDLGNGKIATFKREIYDRFEPIKYKAGAEVAPDAPQAGGNYTASYVAARELKGKIRARGSDLLKELNGIVQPLENNADRQILNKIYSLRNFAELDRLGKTTSGVTEGQALEALGKLEAEVGAERFARISDVAEKVADLQNNKALDILVDGKVITPETAATLRERYPHYLRSEILDRQLAADRPEFASADNGEPIGRINKSFLKTKKGTEKVINTDVLDVVRRSLVTKVAAAEKQQVIDTIVHEFGTQIGTKNFVDGSIVTRVDPKKIPPGYVKSTVPASGNQVYALRADIDKLLQGLNRHEMDMITRSMGAYNRLFKAGATTYRAPFVLSNLFRDAQELLVKSRSVPGAANKVVSYGRALISSVKDAIGMPDELFQAWQRGGGAYGGIVTSIPKDVRIPYRLLAPKEQMGEAASRALMIPFKAVEIPAGVLENTSRLAEYIRLKPTKLPESLKILNSRDITVDFEKMGDAMKLFNTYIPFLNPSVQGTMNIGRVIRDQPLATSAKIAAYVGVPTVGLYAWNRRFANDDLVDPYIKDNFWYINTGQETLENGRKVPIILTFRKGETAQLFSNPVQGMLEYSSRDKNFQTRMAEWNPGGIARDFATAVLPPLLKEPMEQAANYDFFRQGPIIPQRLEDVRPGFQFTRGTTNTARRLGEKYNVSPIRVEHAGYGIWPASRQALQLMDVFFNPKPTFPRPERDAYEMSRDFQPVVRTPTGYFSQDEAIARRFQQQYKEGARTPAFLFKEAMTRYAQDRSQENLARVQQFAAQLPARQRQSIINSVREEVQRLNLTPTSRAASRMSRAERRAFARELQNQNR